jgi:hypothetical protein
MGVRRRRRFGVDKGRLTAYEDEHLADPTETERRSAILQAEIERPRVGPMRDIVATIQPEQDEIVRSDLDDDRLRPGRAGHRQDRRRPAPRGVAALCPPRPAVPRRGARRRPQPRLPRPHRRRAAGARRGRGPAHDRGRRWSAARPARGVDATDTAVLKGDPRMAELLRRAVWSHVGTATEPLVVPRGARKWRVAAYLVADVLDELRERGVRYGAAGRCSPSAGAPRPARHGARR